MLELLNLVLGRRLYVVEVVRSRFCGLEVLVSVELFRLFALELDSFVRKDMVIGIERDAIELKLFRYKWLSSLSVGPRHHCQFELILPVFLLLLLLLLDHLHYLSECLILGREDALNLFEIIYLFV